MTEQNHSDQKPAFGLRDLVGWLGHSVVAGLIMFVGLWTLVGDFPFERALRFGLGTLLAAFIGGLVYFGIVYVLAREFDKKGPSR